MPLKLSCYDWIRTGQAITEARAPPWPKFLKEHRKGSDARLHLPDFSSQKAGSLDRPDATKVVMHRTHSAKLEVSNVIAARVMIRTNIPVATESSGMPPSQTWKYQGSQGQVVADCPWKQSSAHRKGKQNMALVKVLPSQPHLWKDLTHHG